LQKKQLTNRLVSISKKHSQYEIFAALLLGSMKLWERSLRF